MLQPKPTSNAVPEPMQEDRQRNNRQAQADTPHAQATPPGTAKPLTKEDIERLRRHSDQDEVSQQEIDAATGQADDTLTPTMTDKPEAGAQDHPVQGEDEDLGITPADIYTAGD